MKRNYNDPVYKEWRMRVYKRDKFTCQMPNCKCKKRLQAHHIKKWSQASILRYEVDNGITLCKWCHDMVTGKELCYEPLFTEIVRSKK
jgi:hypothetical protein